MNCRSFVLIIGLTSISLLWQVEEVRSLQSFNFVNEPATFNDAFETCKSKSSQLLVIECREAQESAERYLNMYLHVNTSLAFINMRRRKLNDSWYLLNGTQFNGAVLNKNWDIYRIYLSLIYTNNWIFYGEKPFAQMPYLCEFYDPNCSSTSDGIRYDGKCLVRFETAQLTWFDARVQCISKNGDLAQFNQNIEKILFKNPPFDTASLKIRYAYWVGIRLNNQFWTAPADSPNETYYFNWSAEKPDNLRFDCVCLDPNGTPRWSWMDCNCHSKRLFLCQIDLERATYASEPGTTPISKPREKTDDTPKNTYGSNLAFIIAIMVGLLFFLLFTLCLLCCCLGARRRKKRKSQSNADASLKASGAIDRSEKQSNADASLEASGAFDRSEKQGNADASLEASEASKQETLDTKPSKRFSKAASKSSILRGFDKGGSKYYRVWKRTGNAHKSKHAMGSASKVAVSMHSTKSKSTVASDERSTTSKHSTKSKHSMASRKRSTHSKHSTKSKSRGVSGKRSTTSKHSIKSK